MTVTGILLVGAVFLLVAAFLNLVPMIPALVVIAVVVLFVLLFNRPAGT